MCETYDIRDHPKFREQRDPEEPLGGREEPQESLGTRGEQGRKLMVGPAICSECRFKRDSRTFWRRWFLPRKATTEDFSCSISHQIETQNPVTGRRGYVPEGIEIAVYAREGEAFTYCKYLNPSGICDRFEAKSGGRPMIPEIFRSREIQ